ncbi:MAG TPA: hypothetical protein VML55_16070 [Planctomycetaceae bacterium]|nr:hypothetical protein [Planctomycetaceae bacterium]
MPKRCLWIGGLLLAAVAGGAGMVSWAFFQVPEFYQEAAATVRDPAERKAASESFVQQTTRLANEISHSDRWSQTFTPLQINSWLAEELPVHYAGHIPRGVSEPRVHVDGDALLIGFHYQHKKYSGVVSIRLKPSVPAENRLAVEVESVRAGLVPISIDSVLDQLSRRLARAGWPVEWTHVDGRDIALVSLDGRRSHRAVLESVQVADGTLRIGGRRAARSGGMRTAYLQRPSRTATALGGD